MTTTRLSRSAVVDGFGSSIVTAGQRAWVVASMPSDATSRSVLPSSSTRVNAAADASNSAIPRLMISRDTSSTPTGTASAVASSCMRASCEVLSSARRSASAAHATSTAAVSATTV